MLAILMLIKVISWVKQETFCGQMTNDNQLTYLPAYFVQFLSPAFWVQI